MTYFINIIKTLITEQEEEEDIYPFVSRKVGDYVYKGYTKSKETSIFNQIGKAFDIRRNKSLPLLIQVPQYEKYIDEVYADLVKNNPELADIKTNVSNYGHWTFPKHDIVFGALSGIPPKDIKFFVENIKGTAMNLKSGTALDGTKQYVSVKNR